MTKIPRLLFFCAAACAIALSGFGKEPDEFALHAFAIWAEPQSPAGWSVEEIPDTGFEARNASHPGWKIPLAHEVGTPRLVAAGVATGNPRIGALLFDAGGVGTKTFVAFYKAVLFDVSNGRPIGRAAIVAYVDSETNEPCMKQPEWKWADDEVRINDTQYLETKVIRLDPAPGPAAPGDGARVDG